MFRKVGKLNSRQLLIALHIRAGVKTIWELNVAIGKHKTYGYTQKSINELKEIGIISYNGKRAAVITEQGREVLANYCLLPGGGVGEIERVEQAARYVKGMMVEK